MQQTTNSCTAAYDVRDYSRKQPLCPRKGGAKPAGKQTQTSKQTIPLAFEVACCMPHVACRMLHVVGCMTLQAASCMLRCMVACCAAWCVLYAELCMTHVVCCMLHAVACKPRAWAWRCTRRGHLSHLLESRSARQRAQGSPGLCRSPALHIKCDDAAGDPVPRGNRQARAEVLCGSPAGYASKPATGRH
jgi:hypothetical protein